MIQFLFLSFLASLEGTAPASPVEVMSNSTQGWRLLFDQRGVLFTSPNNSSTWGLELLYTGVEEVKLPAAPARLRRNGRRISLERPGLEEWFVNQPKD